MSGSDWRGTPQALESFGGHGQDVDASRPRSRVGRWLSRHAWRWPRPVGAAAAFVVTMAVLAGVAGAVTIGPDGPTTTPPSPPPAAAPSPTPPESAAWPWDTPALAGPGGTPDSAVEGYFAAVSGDGCQPTDSADAAAVYPADTPVESLSGGWTGRACAGGGFWPVPMSGSQKDDPRVYAVWWFATSPVVRGACEIWVYVADGDELQVAGKPTHYLVTQGKGDPRVIGRFAIDQTAHRGSWVRGGVVRHDNGLIAVRMGNRGVSSTGGRHAAAQVAVVCTPR